MITWKLIRDKRGPSSYNMEKDLSLMGDVIDRRIQGAFRIYNWQSPAVSFGYHQHSFTPFDDTLEIETVRRPTGGGAVLHFNDFTYSVSSRLEGPFSGGLIETYSAISKVFAYAMRECGVDVDVVECEPTFSNVCFDRSSPMELMCSGTKIMGAAQARKRDAFLQQGVIPLDVDRDLAAGVFGPDINFTGINELCPGFDRDLFVVHLREGFLSILGVLLSDSDEYQSQGRHEDR